MKIIKLITCAILLLAGCQTQTQPSSLPLPEKEEGLRGEQFGIDKNINEKTIDQYLFRDDVVYRDMRMLKDEANYEAIGGDSWLSGIVEGFEVVPYPYLVNVNGLPSEVGNSYQGETLFYYDGTNYIPNYKESMDMLNYYFPKDKAIFLMCGGGGYAGMTKEMLVSLGWDSSKIYNVGGYWFYEGNHDVKIKNERDGETYYDFYKLNYHYIDFSSLHQIHENPQPTTDAKQEEKTTVLENLTNEQFEKLIEEKQTFAISVYLPGCASCQKFAPVVHEVANSKQIPIYEMNLLEAKEKDNLIGQTVDYTPSIVIFKEGELQAYLDANSANDYPYYENAQSLTTWMQQYVPIDIIQGDASSQIEECEEGCSVFE